MTTLEDKEIFKNAEEGLDAEVLRMSNDELLRRTRLLDNEIKIMRSDIMRVSHEQQAMKDKIKENTAKIKVNKTLPYLVSNVVEILDVDPQDQEEIDGANVDLDSQRKGSFDDFINLGGSLYVQKFVDRCSFAAKPRFFLRYYKGF